MAIGVFLLSILFLIISVVTWEFLILNFSDANHEGNIKKMKILTMVSIACEQPEIEFTSLAKQLMLNEDEVEEFVIEGKSTWKLILT